MGICARCSCGTPFASKPASTWDDPSAGSMLPAGSSSFSLPRSTSCSAAIDVSSLTIEAMRKIVSLDIGDAVATSRKPNAPS